MEINKKQEIIKFIKFNIVGILNTVIDACVYMLLRELVGVPYTIAAVCGYGCGLMNSYFCNKKWTFNRTDKSKVQLFKFIVVNMISFSISLGLLTLFEMMGFNQTTLQVLIAKGIASVITVVINFIGTRIWVFKE